MTKNIDYLVTIEKSESAVDSFAFSSVVITS